MRLPLSGACHAKGPQATKRGRQLLRTNRPEPPTQIVELAELTVNVRAPVDSSQAVSEQQLGERVIQRIEA